MQILTTLSGPDVVAVMLAAVGAVLFGLAAVRQHGVVQQADVVIRPDLREHLRSALRLVRQPSWLIGAGQAGLGGALHVVALTLAPITLVQPIGVLAVPVTVVATSLLQRRRPRRNQVLGSLMSIVGIAVLTVCLLSPSTNAGTVPGWSSLGLTVVAALAVGLIVVVAGSRRRPALRCVSLATTAAVLFGLNSLLIRTIGEIVAAQTVPSELPVLVIAIAGIGGALPLGVWAMQSAYVSGSPQVVICCLTLIDPLAAVVGGRVLLHDGAALTGSTLLAVIICALVAAGGVLLLSGEYPAEGQLAVAGVVPVTERRGVLPIRKRR